MNIYANNNWQPKEWEQHVNNLLRTKHGQENYIKIPDGHSGDAGIEGYSLSGNAYQCYAPEELCGKAELCEKQKNKITRDIKKFIDNKDKLHPIFGSTKIKRWILVVPNHVSKDLIIHANKKASEVLAKNLPYVEKDDFRLLIWDRDEFAAEEVQLINSGLYKLKLHCDEVPDAIVDSFEFDGDQTIENINGKLAKISGLSDAKKGDVRYELIRHFIFSGNLLQQLMDDYPEYYEEIDTIKKRRERAIKLESIPAHLDSLSTQSEKLLRILESGSNLHSENNESISWGAVADWLMRCPLDFNE